MTRAGGFFLGAAILASCGCMAYRGPSGVEDALERRLGVELHREVGFKLGPISTRIAGSIVGDDLDGIGLHGVSSIGLAVYEVGAANGRVPGPVDARDLGVPGWSTLLAVRAPGEQVLMLARPGQDSIRELMFLSVESDEVVVARIKGHLDKLIAETIDRAEHGTKATKETELEAPLAELGSE